VACAESAAVATSEELRAFVARVGFPVILKPRDAAGAAGTGRADDWAQLDGAIASWGLDRGGSVAVEEFVEGHEGVYDTISRDGQVVHEFIGHYFPNVLEAMRQRWINASFVTTNRVGEPAYQELREMGAKVIRTLGIGTSATHMEWFFGPKGLKFSEIGCRPAGVLTWDLYSAANEMDVYSEWARAILGQPIVERPSRRYNGGMLSLRPDRDGRISGYEGLEETQNRYGPWILDAHLPPPGTPTQPIESGFMANAWMRLRHPDYDELRGILDWIGRNVRVLAS
jgi:formate-dependent phosphoribosylglycinamide formyltransferase (GAR transformylase)